MQYEKPTDAAATIAHKFRVLLMRVDKFKEYNFNSQEYPNSPCKLWKRSKDHAWCKECNAVCGKGHCFFCYGQVQGQALFQCIGMFESCGGCLLREKING